MATGVKSSKFGAKQTFYPNKPPSTPSPKLNRKAESNKLDRGPLSASGRKSRSCELDSRSSKRKLVDRTSKLHSQDEPHDENVCKVKSKVLEELRHSENDEGLWRRRGFSYPGEHGTIPQRGLDIMQKETKLVVLEYLSSLPSDKIRARNKDVAKAKSIHITGNRPVVQERKRASLYRSSSDAGQNFEEARKKLKEMAVPLKRQLSTNVLEEIKRFDKAALKSKESLVLNLGKNRPPSPSGQPRVLSPESLVVSRLEDMSHSIMRDFPQLLDDPISDILTPLDSGDSLNYETFAAVAKAVFEQNFVRFSGTLWSRISLVLYFAREVLYVGNLNDTQMEMLVEFSAKFVTENSHTFIKKQGGWGALELEDDILLANGSLFDPSDFEGSTPLRRQDEVSYDATDGRYQARQETVSGFVNRWMSYGMAVAAVGLGVAYGVMKHC